MKQQAKHTHKGLDVVDINTRVNLTLVLIIVAFLLLYVIYRLST